MEDRTGKVRFLDNHVDLHYVSLSWTWRESEAGQRVRIKDYCTRRVFKAFCLEGHSLLEYTAKLDNLKRTVTKVNLMFLLEC